MTPRVSYIIPAYNAAATLGATLRSLLAQREDRWEAVVVDDGSRDGTASAAASVRDARVQVVRIPNSGPAVARERGWAVAQGEYVVFLDADDQVTPDHGARLLEAARGLDSAACGLIAVDEHGRERGFRQVPAPGAWDAPSVWEGCPMQLACALLHRRVVARVIDRYGSLMDVRCHCEDWDFWMRVAAVGCSWGGIVEDALVRYTRAAGSRSRGLIHTLRDGRAALLTHAGDRGPYFARRHAVRVLGRATASNDEEAAREAHHCAAPLEPEDDDLLAAAMHGQYLLDADVRAGDWEVRRAAAEASIRACIPAFPRVGHLAFRATLCEEAWARVAEVACDQTPAGGRLVLVGFGRNGQAVARHVRPGVRLACIDDRRVDAGPRQIDDADLTSDDLALVTPHERGSLLQRLARSAARVTTPEGLLRGEPACIRGEV